MASYGTTSRVKTDWMQYTDATSDTQIDNLLTNVAEKINNILKPFVTVPLTGDAITDTVKRLAEQWCAGLVLQSQRKTRDEFDIGVELAKNAEDAINLYAEGLFDTDSFLISQGQYKTEPIRSGV